MTAKRRKHVPLRTCISCRKQAAKRDMLRVVRTPEGAVEFDPRGKRSGRGAYVCRNAKCMDTALRAGILGRALKCQVTAEQVAYLEAIAQELLAESPPPGPVPVRLEESRTEDQAV